MWHARCVYILQGAYISVGVSRELEEAAFYYVVLQRICDVFSKAGCVYAKRKPSMVSLSRVAFFLFLGISAVSLLEAPKLKYGAALSP